MDSDKLMVKPGSRAKLAGRNPDDAFGYTKDKAEQALLKHQAKLAELQELLYAEKKYALLIVLQALDAGGKDGTIRHPLPRSLVTISCGAYIRLFRSRARSGFSTVRTTKTCS
jgi:polyphosphate kinase 2 (PPK2 family)